MADKPSKQALVDVDLLERLGLSLPTFVKLAITLRIPPPYPLTEEDFIHKLHYQL